MVRLLTRCCAPALNYQQICWLHCVPSISYCTVARLSAVTMRASHRCPGPIHTLLSTITRPARDGFTGTEVLTVHTLIQWLVKIPVTARLGDLHGPGLDWRPTHSLVRGSIRQNEYKLSKRSGRANKKSKCARRADKKN